MLPVKTFCYNAMPMWPTPPGGQTVKTCHKLPSYTKKSDSCTFGSRSDLMKTVNQTQPQKMWGVRNTSPQQLQAQSTSKQGNFSPKQADEASRELSLFSRKASIGGKRESASVGQSEVTMVGQQTSRISRKTSNSVGRQSSYKLRQSTTFQKPSKPQGIHQPALFFVEKKLRLQKTMLHNATMSPLLRKHYSV